MAMPAVFRKVLDSNDPSQSKDSCPASQRKYTCGQKVMVRMRNKHWGDGCVVAFGNQDYLPLYWVTINGVPEETLAFECELSVKDGN